MIIQISWKNVWRNRTRSLIIMIAILLGISGGLFLIAFMQGMTDQRLSSALKSEVGHIQIHHNKYLENSDFNYYIKDTFGLEDTLKQNVAIKAYSKRVVINSLISTAETGAPIKILGVDPKNEVEVSDIHSKIVKGKYFEGIKRKPIVLGEKLARKLKVKPRSKVVLQIQDTAGTTFPAAFRVAGIYKTNNTTFDEMNAFVDRADLLALTGFDNHESHEFTLILNERELTSSTDAHLESIFPQLQIDTWVEGNAMLAYMSDVMDQYMIVFLAIILLALLFGIMNTMFMAIIERRKELGMLMAIGMNRFRVFLMIMFETIFLCLIGAIIGIIITQISVAYFAKNGLDMSLWAQGLESIGYDPIVYFRLDNKYVLQVIILVAFTAMVASIFPALKALRLKPAEALRIDN